MRKVSDLEVIFYYSRSSLHNLKRERTSLFNMQSLSGLAIHAHSLPALGTEAFAQIQLWWQNFMVDTSDPKRVFRETLEEILKCNEGTSHRAKMGFGSILSYADFKSKLPLTEWTQYEAEVISMLDGHPNVLCSIDPTAFFTSSGTTGILSITSLYSLLIKYFYAAQESKSSFRVSAKVLIRVVYPPASILLNVLYINFCA